MRRRSRRPIRASRRRLRAELDTSRACGDRHPTPCHRTRFAALCRAEGYHRWVRPIRGPRHPADDDRTVEAPPEEPTLSAQVNVRDAFEATEHTLPDALVGLVPIEDDEPRQQQTMPLVSPALVLDLQAKSQARTEVAAVAVAPAIAHVPLPPPSDPILVTRRRDDDRGFGDGDEAPIEIPGVGGAQRKRMLRIVIGVLAVCGLMCVGAVARQVLGGDKEKMPVTATASAAPAEKAASSAVVAAEPSATAVAAAVVPEPAPPPAPPPAAPTPTVRARVEAPPPPPPPPRRPAPAAATPHARPAAGAPAKPRAAIVRDAPF